MRLKYAVFNGCDGLRDYKPLLDCPALEKIVLPRNIKEIEVLRQHPRLRALGYEVDKEKPAAAFWAEFDAIWKAHADDAANREKLGAAFVAAGLSVEDLKQAVGQFPDGTYKIHFDSIARGVNQIPDLHGLPVSGIYLRDCRVTDLSPLAALPIQSLNIRGVLATNYEVLRRCPQLENLTLGAGTLRSLSDLAGLKLKYLNIEDSQIADVSAVAGMPLHEFTLHNSKVADLSAIAGSPLQILRCDSTNVSDWVRSFPALTWRSFASPKRRPTLVNSGH